MGFISRLMAIFKTKKLVTAIKNIPILSGLWWFCSLLGGCTQFQGSFSDPERGNLLPLDSECVVSLLPVSVLFDEKAAEKRGKKSQNIWKIVRFIFLCSYAFMLKKSILDPTKVITLQHISCLIGI